MNNKLVLTEQGKKDVSFVGKLFLNTHMPAIDTRIVADFAAQKLKMRKHKNEFSI